MTNKQCKLILIGNGSVGKTSILSRFQENGFKRVYEQTIGIDFFEKRVTLREGKEPISLRVFDIGGQSIGSKMLPKYVYGADVVFLCYDVTSIASFRDIPDWLAFVHKSGETSEVVTSSKSLGNKLIYLIGNKADNPSMAWKVTKKMHDKFIKEANLEGGFYTSARSGENVVKAFTIAAAKYEGYSLSASELEMLDAVLSVTVQKNEKESDMGEAEKEVQQNDLQHGSFEDILAKAERKERRRCCILQKEADKIKQFPIPQSPPDGCDQDGFGKLTRFFQLKINCQVKIRDKRYKMKVKPKMNLVVVPTTREYRDVARKIEVDWFTIHDDRKNLYCCEVGCCDGVTSEIVYKRICVLNSKRPDDERITGFIACDILQSYVDLTLKKLSQWKESSRGKRFPLLHFRGACVDGCESGDITRKKLGISKSTDRLGVIFIDIAGTAPLPYVYDAVFKLEQEFRPHTIVVKSLKFARLQMQLQNGAKLFLSLENNSHIKKQKSDSTSSTSDDEKHTKKKKKCA
eukprot:g963.t1